MIKMTAEIPQPLYLKFSLASLQNVMYDMAKSAKNVQPLPGARYPNKQERATLPLQLWGCDV